MADGPSYKVKASVFRAYVKWLEQEGRLASVLAKTSPETARLVKAPPLASTWMESAPLDELVTHIEEGLGLEGVRRASQEVLRDQMGPLLTPMVRNILRMIGASPETIFRHWDDLVKTTMREVDWEWRSTSATSGVLVVTYPRGSNVNIRTFFSAVAGLEYALVLAGRRGVVEDPMQTSENSARFEIRWT